MAEKDLVAAAIGALEGASATIDFWLLIFTVIVAIGVVGEAAFGVAHLINAHKLVPLRVREAHLTELEISGANERAAEATRKANEAALALEKYKAPRFVTEGQKGFIIAGLLGKLTDINVVSQADAESHFFASNLASVFQAAGIKVHEGTMLPGASVVVATTGTVVMWDPGPEPGLNATGGLDSTDPLYLALSKAGMFGGWGPMMFSFPGEKPAPPKIHTVYVGQKPPW